MTPHIEPGRLDARVAEFYRKLEAVLSAAAVAEAVARVNQAAEGGGEESSSGNGVSGSGGSGGVIDGSGGGSGGDSGGDRRGTRRDRESFSEPEPEDSAGRKMQCGLGWRDGGGLGRDE